MKCVKCHALLADGARFCSDCGAPQSQECPACSTPVQAHARFCHACGLALTPAAAATRPAPLATAPAPLTDLTAPAPLSTLTQPGALAPAPAGRTPWPRRQESDEVGERRHMSVMFCDLVGSVEMARRLDPEDLRELVRAYRETCAEVIERHGGTMAQFHGDGIVVYFGYPVAHEGDVRRAVQAGLDIVQALTALAPEVRLRHGVDLAVRIAVNTGLTLVGDPDASAGIGRLALGDTPNVAARLQQVAEPGTVVVSEVTQRLVAGFFQMTSLGRQVLKGIAEPIEAFRVEGASGARHRLEAAAKQHRAPYVGRAGAIAALARSWVAAQESPGHAVLLTGDPGVGKSRLLSEFRESIVDSGCDVVECYCSPDYAHTALYPLVAAMRERLGIEQARTPEAAQQALHDELQRHGCEIETALPLLARLFGLAPQPGQEPLTLHPLTQKQKTLVALVTLLTSRASLRPTLMVVEDLHWVDSTTLELLGNLLRELPSSRVLLLMTSRPGFSPPWLYGEHLTLIPVNVLSASDTETLIHRVVGNKRLPPKVLSLLVDKTDGNPLYVEEMTRMFLDSGALRESAGGYEIDGPLPESMVPASLQDLLMARLDRIQPEARRVLQLGACIGREWTFELLLAVLPDEERLLTLGVEQLIGDGIVFATDGGFTIKHALIQDAAYDSLLRRTRQTYHERIALALQAGVGGAAFPERIAQHWTKAGQPARALPHWLQAGQLAVASSATTEAESHLRHGLEAIEHLPASDERDRQELALLSPLGVALTIQQGWAAPAVAAVYQRAKLLSERVGPNPQLFWVLWGLWAFYLVKGEQHRAIEFAERMAGMADSMDSASLRLEADFALGLSHYYMGRLDSAQQLLAASIAQYVPERHRSQAHLTGQDVGVTARAVAAMVLFLRGETRAGLSQTRQAVTLASELKHPFSHAYALGCATWLDALRRDPEAMADHATATIELSSAQSLGFWTVWGSIFAGRALVDEGQAEAGARHMDQALATYRSIGSGMVVPHFLVLQAEVEAGIGEVDRALERLDEARRVISAGGESFMSAEIERLEAQVRLDRLRAGAPIDASTLADIEQRYRRALAIALQQGNRVFALRAACGLAPLLAAQGDLAAARGLIDGAIAAFPDPTPTHDLEQARSLLQALASSSSR
ncbi:AAA family ATPase [Leptothrix sp. BB-4]